MIFIQEGTKLSVHQVNWRQVFSVERILAARGARVAKEGGSTDTILHDRLWSREAATTIFTAFDDFGCRRALTAVANGFPHIPSPSLSNVMSLPGVVVTPQAVTRTFEWYVGELLVRRFHAFSSSFGVTISNFRRPADGETLGDYDVLSVLGDLSLLYLECKTGGCSQQSIRNVLQRSLAINSVASVLFLGAGANVNSLKQQLRDLKHPRFDRSGLLRVVEPVHRPGGEIFKWFDCYFVAADEITGTVEAKLETVVAVIAANRAATFELSTLGRSEYLAMGYRVEDLS